MDTEQLWNEFTESGSIDDYLKYINQRDFSNDDNRGNSPERTCIR